jgi:hypothetical protein
MTGQGSKDFTSTNPYQELLHAVVAAKEAHLRDLRVLVDQSCEREKDLTGMMRIVIEERFYRPVITRPGENKTTPILPPDQLQDVTAFDQAADQAQIEDHEELGRKLQQEFEGLKREEDEYRAQKA